MIAFARTIPIVVAESSGAPVCRVSCRLIRGTEHVVIALGETITKGDFGPPKQLSVDESVTTSAAVDAVVELTRVSTRGR
jgi:hypothetical protein